MLIGSTLGNYRLVRLLGRGGYAEVYLGEHLRLGTQAAIKVLHAHLADHDDTNSFLAEARTVASLEHPHIIRVLDFDVQQDGTAFLVMSYAANGNLRIRHPRGSQLSLQTTLAYVKQIADALQYAHNQRVIHRDLKPENMLLGKNDDLLLSDFGIALIAQSSRVQRTQEIIGTAPYMAPEQLQGKPRLESDQYTLGIITYEWLCGERPFSGSFTELYSQHLFVPPPSLREKVPTLPLEVEEVVQVALAKDPHQRFSSIQAFATALEQAGHTTVSSSVPPATPPSRSVPPHPPINPPAPLLSDEDYAIHDPYAPHPLPLFPETKEPSTSESIGDHIVVPHPLPLFSETKEPSTGIDEGSVRRSGFRDRLRQLLIQTLIATIIIIVSRLTLSLGFSESVLFTGWVAQFGLFFSALIFVGVASGPLPALIAGAGGYFISNVLTGSPLYWQNGLVYALVGCVAGLIHLGMQKRNASLRRRVIRMTITGWVLIIAARIAVYCMFIWLPPLFTPSQTTGEFLQQDLPASLTMLIILPLLLVTYNKYAHIIDNSKGYGWSEGATGSNATCQFVGSTYHIKQPTTNRLAICGGTGIRAYHDFLAQVQMTVLSGDGGGIAFRTNFGTGGYVFYIMGNGAYGIARSDFTEQNTADLYTASSSAIKTGLHQTNLLGVLVQGNTITLFVNQHYLTSLTDNTYSQGVIALGSLSQSDATEVAFSQVELWQL